MIYIIFLLIIISAISKAIKDIIDHKYHSSVFIKYKEEYWNPSISWINKYNSKEEPKFIGSTTIFVFVTDAWHLFQFINQNTLFIAFGLGLTLNYNTTYAIITIIGLKIVYTGVFELFYSKILKK